MNKMVTLFLAVSTVAMISGFIYLVALVPKPSYTPNVPSLRLETQEKAFPLIFY